MDCEIVIKKNSIIGKTERLSRLQQKITQLPVCKVLGEVRDTVRILNEECAELPGQLTQHLFEASAKAQERVKEREIEKEGEPEHM